MAKPYNNFYCTVYGPMYCGDGATLTYSITVLNSIEGTEVACTGPVDDTRIIWEYECGS